MRRTVSEIRKTMLPQDLLLCQSDIPTICAYLNQAIEELLPAGGETGFWGTSYKTAFNVLRSDPYLTTPRQIARVGGAQICKQPVRIQNDWYEFLEAGIGQQGPSCGGATCPPMEMYDRGVYPTAFDIPPGSPQYLKVYLTDPLDAGKRVLFGGLDQNGNGIYNLDGLNTVKGFYLDLASAPTVSTFLVSEIRSVQKDRTYGDVVVNMVNPDTGAESLLARYEPDEIAPGYRRYYVQGMPSTCCANSSTAPAGTTQITVQAKLDFIPVYRDTDFLLIGNLPALLEQCRSIRHAKMDDATMKQLSVIEHNNAIKHLNDELKHYTGTMQPAISFAPFGTAGLERRMIGKLI